MFMTTETHFFGFFIARDMSRKQRKELASFFIKLREVLHDTASQTTWLNSSNKKCDGKTPEEIVRQGNVTLVYTILVNDFSHYILYDE